MIKRALKANNPLTWLILLGVLFSGLSLVYGGVGRLDDRSKTLLTVTSLVFSFYVNSLISQARSRHNKIVESLREEGGYIRAIYEMSKSSFDNETVDGCRQVIDRYLMASMDYRPDDYSKSYPQFRDMYDFLLDMGPENKKQDGAWGQIIRVASELSKARSRIETLVKERISAFEWAILTILMSLVIYFIFNLNYGDMVSAIVTSAIATSLSMLPIILYKLDSLRWKEDRWFWEPLEELFKSLDLVPYYPEILLDAGRLKTKKGEKIRLAKYPNLYPNMEGKRVRVHIEE